MPACIACSWRSYESGHQEACAVRLYREFLPQSDGGRLRAYLRQRRDDSGQRGRVTGGEGGSGYAARDGREEYRSAGPISKKAAATWAGGFSAGSQYGRSEER